LAEKGKEKKNNIETSGKARQGKPERQKASRILVEGDKMKEKKNGRKGRN